MQIDAHQHFWRVDRGDYGWLTAEAHPAICRDFGPEDLKPLMAAAGVTCTVLVQAAPTTAETDFLLEMARATPFVAGVVGWADLEAPDAGATIEAMAGDPKLLGLRPMLQDLADDAWILKPELVPALDAMQAAGLRFLAQRPDLRVVIDHGAKPDIAGGDIEGWAAAMRAIARDSGAVCKLSGL